MNRASFTQAEKMSERHSGGTVVVDQCAVHTAYRAPVCRATAWERIEIVMRKRRVNSCKMRQTNQYVPNLRSFGRSNTTRPEQELTLSPLVSPLERKRGLRCQTMCLTRSPP